MGAPADGTEACVDGIRDAGLFGLAPEPAVGVDANGVDASFAAATEMVLNGGGVPCTFGLATGTDNGDGDGVASMGSDIPI